MATARRSGNAPSTSTRDCCRLLLLDDVRSRLRPTAESFVGLREIEVERIVGTVDRCCDFDRRFRARRGDLASRVGAVQRAFPGGAYPPIDVVQVDRAFFVIDGHKRVAAAHRTGVEIIDANVTRLAVRYPVNADTHASDLPLLEAQDDFLRESGLQRTRPGVRVPSASPRSYAELLAAVKAHGYDLMRHEGAILAPEAIAAHWYDCDYRPTLEVAAQEGVAELLACCPDGELYLMLHRHMWSAPAAQCEALQAAAREAARTLKPSRPGHWWSPARLSPAGRRARRIRPA